MSQATRAAASTLVVTLAWACAPPPGGSAAPTTGAETGAGSVTQYSAEGPRKRNEWPVYGGDAGGLN